MYKSNYDIFFEPFQGLSQRNRNCPHQRRAQSFGKNLSDPGSNTKEIRVEVSMGISRYVPRLWYKISFDKNKIFDPSPCGRHTPEGRERKKTVKLLQGGVLNYGRRLGRGGRTEAVVATDMLVGQ